jgi:hypothetical protein
MGTSGSTSERPATVSNETAAAARRGVRGIEPWPRQPPILHTLGTGALGGLVLGIVARAWMRLIAVDPAFTWSGTLFIVVGFVIFGVTQSIVAVARSRVRRRWKLTVFRVVGGIGMVPLFAAAGALMFPTVVGGGLAFARVEWHKLTRGICLVLAAGPVVFVGQDLVASFGWSFRSVAGFFGLLTVYAAIMYATRFTFARQSDGWRLSLRWTVAIVGGVALLLLVPLAIGGTT